jgi:undecaprenyl phosphate N,N'-diacetylbacillosamine 1-phosphate transferase
MYRAFRNIADRLVGCCLLLMLSPIIIVSILFVKTDGGPAFFFQGRVGKNERIFRVIKLRTMVANSESMLDARGRPTGDRITRFGRFLRRSSIDELPQLLNVIKGDMALIGPRPILPKMLPYLTGQERGRFAVRPGVTGLAQVKGRNYLRWSRRFHYDVIYTQRMSFGLDAYVALRTVKLVFTGEGIAPEANPDKVDDITVRALAQ